MVAFLILMALLLAAVGGLGLATTMSINMMERVREVGILRAIGASNVSVRQIVLAEGLAMAVISWTVGTALSVIHQPDLQPGARRCAHQDSAALRVFARRGHRLVLHLAGHRHRSQPGAGACRRPPDRARSAGL